MTPEQAAKVKEVTALIMEARTARQEAMNFSKVGKGGLVEELKFTKMELKKERREKKEMKQRLQSAFAHSKNLKESHAGNVERHKIEREGWRKLLRKMQDRHADEVLALKEAVNTQTVTAQQRMVQVNEFGERVMKELTMLQEQLHGKEAETKDLLASGEPDSDFFLTQS